MNIDPQEFRQRYDELTDEGLLSIHRHELDEVAQRYYDDELARRGLQARPDPGVEVGEMDEKLVTVATFLFPDEAKLARTLLQSASIRCYLAHEHTLSIVWTWTYALGGLRLMVPVSLVDEVKEILQSVLSNEELASQAEAEMWPALTSEEVLDDAHLRSKRRGSRWLLWSAVIFFWRSRRHLAFVLRFLTLRTRK